MKLAFWFGLLALAGCQFQALEPSSHSPIPTQRINASTEPELGVYPELSPLPIQAQATLQATLKGHTLSLRLKLPPLTAFRTQRLDLAAANKIMASVSDSRGQIYYATGADITNQVAYPVSGVITLNFQNIVPDDLIFINLQVINNSLVDIPQANLAAVLKHTSSANTTTAVNFQTSAVAKTMSTLLSSNASRARSLNLTALNTLMNNITGISGTAPNYTYSNHPSLVLTSNLASALVASDPGSLSAITYRGTGGTLNLNVSGLIGSDKLQVQICDAATAIKSNLGNGANSITGVTPGSDIQVKVSAFGSPIMTYTYTPTPTILTVSEGSTQSLNIVATPTVSVSSFSPTAGAPGTLVTITGTGFTGATAVRFNGVNASSFTVISNTQITATVPGGAADGPITVVNGGSAISASSFNVYRTIFVKADASGSNNGSSWANAYTNLKTALDATSTAAGDQLWIAAGTYTPGLPNTNSFQMKANVDMYGGFNGSETLLSQRNPATSVTVLSGDLDGDDTGSGAAYTIVGTNSKNVIRGASNATLDGFTIRAGNATSPGFGNGGGMFNGSVSVNLNNLTFENNVAAFSGGGLYYPVSGTPTLSNLRFLYNKTNSSTFNVGGGGLHLSGSGDITLNNLTFIQNSTGGSVGGGGFMHERTGTTTLTNAVFDGNTTAGLGGAIANYTGSLNLNQISLINNNHSGTGGIHNAAGATLNLNNSRITGQSTSTGLFNIGTMTLTDVSVGHCKQGIYSGNSGANATLIRVFIHHNGSADINATGGGMFIGGSTQASLTNVVFANNALTGSGSSGGGLGMLNATTTLQNVTFSNNTAPTGGGLYNYLSSLVMRNVLFWNSPLTGGTVGSSGNLNAGSNPFIDAASPLGIDNLPMTSDDGLQVNSSVNNSGVSTDAPAQDILGRNRVGTPESGAYEYIP